MERLLFILGLITLVVLPAQAPRAADAVWDRDLAHAAASDPVTVPVTDALLDLTPLVGAAAIRARIDALQSDASLPLPARERILRDYAYRLREAPPDAVAWLVLEDLGHFQSRVRVPHPEFPSAMGPPLFDVASAARGTLNVWTRAGAAQTARRALQEGDLDALIRLTDSSHPQQALGAADAVGVADTVVLEAWTSALDQALIHNPSLAPLAFTVAARLRHPALLRTVIDHGAGPWPARAVRDAASLLSSAEALALLDSVARSDRLVHAAIAFDALARLAPSRPETAELLLDRLESDELGAAAALALGNIADDALLTRLGELARNGHADLRRRARQALAGSRNPRASALLDALDRQEVSP